MARAGNDPDVSDRLRTARDAAHAFDQGRPTQGLPSLDKQFGDKIAQVLIAWLGLRPGQAAGLPVIQLGVDLDATAGVAEQALIDAELPIWQRDEMLVRPFIVSAHGAGNRKTKTGKLLQITPIMMRSLMGQAARFEQFDGRAKAFVPAKPRSTWPSLILARSGHWPFPAIRGLLMAPSMRPDGSLITRPGYDPESELYLLDPPPMPAIPDQPTGKDAEQALKLLVQIFEEFPLDDDDSEAVAYSALITPIVRAALDRVPLHAVTAPDIGTGKSYLIDCCSAVATGFPCPVIGLGKDEAEFEKRLNTALIAGHPLVSIDNISRPLASDALCRAIERPSHKVRVLGESRDVHVEPFFTAFATGNNLALSGDIVRRTITCGLDRQEENPYLHRFSGKPLRTIAENRGVYIAACLTIVRAFRVSGEPPLPPLASFEAWSDNVRSALVWLGCGDPVRTITTAREEDSDRQNFIALYEAWKAVVGTDAITCGKLAEKADMKNFSGGYLHPDLRDALLAVAGGQGRDQYRPARAMARPAPQHDRERARLSKSRSAERGSSAEAVPVGERRREVEQSFYSRGARMAK